VTLWIDHVILAVADLDQAAHRLRHDHGLGSYVGGRHPSWGTGNRIVPLGRDYVELVGVVDPDVARTSAFGRRVLGAAESGTRLLGWSVATDDLQAEADRLALEVQSASRVRPDGAILRWRSAGFEETLEHPDLPFFIAWDVAAHLHPGYTPSKAGPGILRVDVRGEPDRLARWLGPSSLPVIASPGSSEVRQVVVDAGAGAVVLGGS
jgi:hypothetical protein